jgi:gamma-glutamyltranspeptidase
MAPTIVVDHEDNVKMVTGGAGGSYIATTVAQVPILLYIDYINY